MLFIFLNWIIYEYSDLIKNKILFNKGNKLINVEIRVFKYINSCFFFYFMNFVYICYIDYIKIRIRKDDIGLKKLRLRFFFLIYKKFFYKYMDKVV